VTYQDRLERKAALLREWAEKRGNKADAALLAAHQAVEGIPFGQPVLLGHHSQRRHEKALETQDRKMRDSVESSDMARSFYGRAIRAEAHAEAIAAQDALALEPYKVGDCVRVVFTNNNCIWRYEGEIVDATLNSWKVKPSTSPYGEDGGYFAQHIHKASRAGRPGHTANNRIEGFATTGAAATR